MSALAKKAALVTIKIIAGFAAFGALVALSPKVIGGITVAIIVVAFIYGIVYLTLVEENENPPGGGGC